MKKQILIGAVIASMATFSACRGNSDKGATDSGAVSKDTPAINTGTGAAEDTGVTLAGAPTQAGAAAGDTSANKRDTAATGSSTPK